MGSFTFVTINVYALHELNHTSFSYRKIITIMEITSKNSGLEQYLSSTIWCLRNHSFQGSRCRWLMIPWETALWLNQVWFFVVCGFLHSTFHTWMIDSLSPLDDSFVCYETLNDLIIKVCSGERLPQFN